MTESKRYRGHVSAMRADNEFLGAEDLLDRGDVWLKIEGVYEHKNRKACGKNQEIMYTLKLMTDKGQPCKKEFWLKSTNRQKITSLYGPDTTNWEGKWLCLYVTEVKSPTGGMTLGIRIKDKKEPPAKQGESHDRAD